MLAFIRRRRLKLVKEPARSALDESREQVRQQFAAAHARLDDVAERINARLRQLAAGDPPHAPGHE